MPQAFETDTSNMGPGAIQVIPNIAVNNREQTAETDFLSSRMLQYLT